MATPTSLSEKVYQDIINDVVKGVYTPDKILNEKTLVEKYQISKTPVREALVRLCSEGVLKNLPRYGYQVVPISPQEIHDCMGFRVVLELGALERSIERITPKEVALLEENVSQAESLAGEMSGLKHWEHNVAFHLLLCSFAKNTFFDESLRRVLQFHSRAANQYFVKLWSENQEADISKHRKLVEALKKKDLPEASTILKEDISFIFTSLL